MTFLTIQVGTLNNIEFKKRFEVLKAVTGIMDAHLRYFQQVYGIITCTYTELFPNLYCTYAITENSSLAGVSAITSVGTFNQ